MSSLVDFQLLAEAVADGSEVDWDRAEACDGSVADRAIVRQFRHLANLCAAARADSAQWGSLLLRDPVGRGSFGTVFRAWDTRLEREVALKLIDRGSLSEGQLLAKIRHPHVVTVYGADMFDGRAGIWMEFITGDTLKTIVDAKGPFGAAEAALIGRDLCGALAAVHGAGLLHRDIKAQNVMREAGGRTVLMDFGAGAGTSAAADVPLAGTPAYVAPEILDGAAPDVRSDLYALGVLLFYLVSGSFPVSGANLDVIREAHVARRRQRLRDLRPDLPRAFIRVVDQLTAPDPADRPASAGVVEHLLETALGIGGDAETIPSRPSQGRWGPLAAVSATLVLVVAAVLIGSSGWRGGGQAQRPRASVAILPFKNLTPGATQDDYLTEGLTADLSAQLSNVKDLRVIAGVSTRRYGEALLRDRNIASELGVAAVLEGNVRQDGERIRIVSRLTDAASGEQLWSESFERSVRDLISVQAEVARRIAVALKGELTEPDRAALMATTARDVEAVRLYAKGRYYAELRTEDGLNRSLELYQAAVAHDSKYAAPHAGMAESYTALGTYGFLPRKEAFARASVEASRSVELDGSLAEAHAALGYALKNQFRWEEAATHLERAIALKPSWATGHHWYSILLTQQGRFAEAITQSRQAISLDPLAVAPNLQLGAVLLMARRYDEAVKQYERALQIEPVIASAYRSIALARTFQGDFAAALAAFEHAIRQTPAGAEDQETTGALGYLRARSGERQAALRVVRELSERYSAAGEQVAANVAGVYAGLGDSRATLTWLERAVERGDAEIGYLKVDPRWDPVRDSPAFTTLLTRVGFTEEKR
jgi:eukaryotic-like serine/threonine-protein kinase